MIISKMDKKILSTYAGILLLSLAALLVIQQFNIYYPLLVRTTTTSTELAVVGEGKVEVVPDTASINAGITIDNADSIKAAQDRINSVNNAIIENMKSLGVKKENIKTSNYSIYPAYDQSGQRSGKYSGNVEIAIKTSNVSQISNVIQKATDSGANQIYGVNMSIEKPELYREQARKKAIDNAKEQANKMAKELNIRLGKVVNIIESTPGSYPIYQTKAFESAPFAGGGGGGPVVEPGTQTVSSTVTIYFEKK